MVSLLSYNPNISLNLFGILVTRPVVNLKVSNVSYKLGFYNINCYLPPVGNV